MVKASTWSAPKLGVAAAAALGFALLVWTFRVQIAELLLCGTMLRAYAHKHLGVKRRPKSSWSSLGRTAALMFAAWNSRWLKGSSMKVSVPARLGVEDDPDNPLNEL